ncbi:MAG: 23S rRNA (uracil(1939)-C(5))-methyltransferase RlmD [Clostridia bacterium]
MDFPINKNDDLELTITGLNSEGAGVARHLGVAVFVKTTVVGETVRAHIIKVNKNYAIGKLMGITKVSKDRVTPLCSEYFKCGGCSLQHIVYEKQLEFKRDMVSDALLHIGGNDCQVLPTLPIDAPIRFRNKASFPFSIIDGRAHFGFFAERSHRLIPINDCVCVSEIAVKIAKTVTEFLNDRQISIYDEETKRGVVRHVVIRTNEKEEAQVTIVSTVPIRHKDELIERLLNEVPSILGIINNINKKETNMILGNEYQLLYGELTFPYEIMGMKFRVHPASFLQVNHAQTVKLYSTAIEYLGAGEDDIVFDVYSGIGTMSLLLAKSVKKVIGIENIKEAVENSVENAKLNGVQNAEFVCEAAETALPRLIKEGIIPNGVILDPPRRGCEGAVIDALIASGTKRIVYVSCRPGTLARDIKLFIDGGFEVKKVQPVDMFGYSAHVETVVLLSHKNS